MVRRRKGRCGLAVTAAVAAACSATGGAGHSCALGEDKRLAQCLVERKHHRVDGQLDDQTRTQRFYVEDMVTRQVQDGPRPVACCARPAHHKRQPPLDNRCDAAPIWLCVL